MPKMEPEKIAEIVADLEFGNAGVFAGRANPDYDIPTLKERFEAYSERQTFVEAYLREMRRKLSDHFELLSPEDGCNCHTIPTSEIEEVAFRAIMKWPKWAAEVLDVDIQTTKNIYDYLNRKLNGDLHTEYPFSELALSEERISDIGRTLPEKVLSEGRVLQELLTYLDEFFPVSGDDGWIADDFDYEIKDGGLHIKYCLEFDQEEHWCSFIASIKDGHILFSGKTVCPVNDPERKEKFLKFLQLDPY